MGLDGLEIEMGSDLSLDLRYFVSKAVKQARDAPTSDVDAYIYRLEEERNKIEMFGWELPLCVRLLVEVIDVMKAEAGKKMKRDLKAAEEEDGTAGDKTEWMSMAQLWTRDSSQEDKESDMRRKGRSSLEVASRGGDAFLSFKPTGSSMATFAPLCFRVDEKPTDTGIADLSLSSQSTIKNAPIAGDTSIESRCQVVGFAHAAVRAVNMAPSTPPSLSLHTQQQHTPQHKQQHVRKAKRTWSLELHHQFVAALNQLGGPQVATPKHIRKLMKVDGLTNDEVKSHLQRYRLRNRRASRSAIVSQPTVRIGGLWIPREQSSSHFGSRPWPLDLSTSGLGVSSASTVSYEKEDGRSESYD